MKFFRSACVLLVPLLLCMLACRDQGVKSIERETLFSLEIGPMEDQIAMYNPGGMGGIKKAGFTMRDGLFYIADGPGAKVVRYNSWGDLLFMIYNEELNPVPVNLITNMGENIQATRWAYSYPLLEPGEIAVDSQRHIYVEDKLPEDRHLHDAETRSLFDRIILHFDADGRFIEYLGKEGVGGTPFPQITGLYTSQRDELAVVCRLPTGWNIYWYSAGTLLYLVQLKNNAIPVLPGWPQQLVPSVDAVMAAPDARKLYIKVDYYRNTVDESTNTRTGTEAFSSLVWALNVEDGTYASTIQLPFYEITASVNGRPEVIKVPYSLMGVIRNGRVLLYYPSDEGYSLLFLSANSQERRRGFVKVDSSALMLNVFDMSAEGLLSAMLAEDFQVTVAWWRTDRFVGDMP